MAKSYAPIISFLIILFLIECSTTINTPKVPSLSVGCPISNSSAFKCVDGLPVDLNKPLTCIQDIYKADSNTIVNYSDPADNNDAPYGFYRAADVVRYYNSRAYKPDSNAVVNNLFYPLIGKGACKSPFDTTTSSPSSNDTPYKITNCPINLTGGGATLDCNQSIYYYDTYSTDLNFSDSPNFTEVSSGNDWNSLLYRRVFYVYFKIDKFKASSVYPYRINPEVKHELKIFFTFSLFPGVHNYYQMYPSGISFPIEFENSNITYINPSSWENYPKSDPSMVEGVLKITLPLNYSYSTPPPASEYISPLYYGATVKTTYPDYEKFPAKPDLAGLGSESAIYSTPLMIQVSNFQKFFNDSSSISKRKMTIAVLGNGVNNDLTQYYATTNKDGKVSFQNAFENAWGNVNTSDIHAVPNFVNFNGSFQAIPVSKLLMSDDGYILLWENEMQTSKTIMRTAKAKFDLAFNRWRFRYEALLSKLYTNNYDTSFYSSLNLPDLFTSSSSRNFRMNRGHMLVCNGFKVIRSQDYPYSSGTVLDNYTITNDSVAADSIVLSIKNNDPIFNGGEAQSFVDNSNIDNSGIVTLNNGSLAYGIIQKQIVALDEVNEVTANIPTADQTWVKSACIAIALHEFAHQWYDKNIYYAAAPDDVTAHSWYIQGVGSSSCLYRSPGNLSGGTRRSFMDAQIKQMRFSEGIENRLANNFYFNLAR